MLPNETNHARTVGASIHKVTGHDETVCTRIELHLIEQGLKLRKAAMHIAHDDRSLELRIFVHNL